MSAKGKTKVRGMREYGIRRDRNASALFALRKARSYILANFRFRGAKEARFNAYGKVAASVYATETVLAAWSASVMSERASRACARVSPARLGERFRRTAMRTSVVGRVCITAARRERMPYIVYIYIHIRRLYAVCALIA